MTTAYELARKEIGVKEWKDGHNPVVLQYFKDAGHPQIVDDETAWCAAFANAMLKRAGIKGTGKLTARSFLDWGTPVELSEAREGDIVIIPRGTSSWQGHVFFFVKQQGAFIKGLGGNQKNSVNEQMFPIAKGKILGIRRPPQSSISAKPSAGKVKPAAVAAGAVGLAIASFWDRISAFFNSLF